MYSQTINNYNLYSAYPERKIINEGWINKTAVDFVGLYAKYKSSNKKYFDEFIELVNNNTDHFSELSNDEILEVVRQLRMRLHENHFNNIDYISEVFGLVREIAGREINMRHFDVQLIGGLVMLQGRVAEMETGEGKTLTATLPACAAALSGLPVHIITVNDYLVKRDSNLMQPIYHALGLTVGVIVSGMSPEERRKAYKCDITYCSNKEIAFDYLKDRITLGKKRSRMRLKIEELKGGTTRIDKLLMRGLCFAIVDEADSVLIDEARTPLIISGSGDIKEEKKFYEEALSIACELNLDEDFSLHDKERNVRLTEQGKIKIESLISNLSGIWKGKQRREELLAKALAAIYLYMPDKQYLVKDGKVQIIDEFTGRVMPDRSWESGLHQLIETKEGCDLSSRRETLARISYQKLFRRYLHLSGMTGTGTEVENELWSVYRLNVIKIPTNKPVRRTAYPEIICGCQKEKWDAVVTSITNMRETGRPVLIGTRSVEASEHLSELLHNKNIEHCVLNARQDEEEASIINQAGKEARITVATNMAGRGTDIKLDDSVSANGGLHVILTEIHESKRIDRQLFGRCGRQGDLGSYETILSIEDELFSNYINEKIKQIAQQLESKKNPTSQAILSLLMKYSQWTAERFHKRARCELLKMDDQLDIALAFSGQTE